MADKPLVSIITPTYNASGFVEQTINSVKNQTLSNWELIICDDLSQDNTIEIVRKYIENDPRIKLIPMKENSGAAVARNTGIEAASGRYIAFLDSDDMWLPEKLDKQISFMQDKDIAFSFTGYEVINDDGTTTGKIVKVPQVVDYSYLLKNTIIGCLTVILDKEKLGEVKMPVYRTRQDFALWLSILRKGYKAYGLDENLAKYRKTAGSISRNKIKAAKQNWVIYRKHEKLNFLYAAWCFANYALNGYLKNRN